jgi:translation initiation factor 2 subunit 1
VASVESGSVHVGSLFSLGCPQKVFESCFHGCQAALQEGFKASKEECEVKINLVAHPQFVLTCVCRDKQTGLATLDDAIERIKVSIESQKGEFELRSKPEVMGQEEKHEESSDEGDSEDEEGSEQEAMPELDQSELDKLMKMKIDDDD